MPFYQKSEIRRGMYMELDAPVDSPVYVKRSQPRPPVRYGDPQPFSEVSQRLDEVRARLEKLRTDLRAARQRR